MKCRSFWDRLLIIVRATEATDGRLDCDLSERLHPSESFEQNAWKSPLARNG